MRKEIVITARTNPTVIRYQKLQDKKYRQSEALFLCEGAKLFSEAVAASAQIEALLLCEGRAHPLIESTMRLLAENPAYAETPVYRLLPSVFEKISSEKSPEGVICVLKYLDKFRYIAKIENNVPQDEKIMLLDGVRDPGNVGAIVRSAVAFGFDRLVFSSDCADLYNSKTMRAAMGTLFGIRADIVTDLAASISALRACGRRVFAAELRDGALPPEAVGLCGRDCVVIGNEGHGISPAHAALCTGSVYIPIAEGAESLNAAVAASLFAYLQKS